VQAHTSDTNQDGFSFGTSQCMDTGKHPTNAIKANLAKTPDTTANKRRNCGGVGKQVTFDPDLGIPDTNPTAQLSLADSLNNGFCFNV